MKEIILERRPKMKIVEQINKLYIPFKNKTRNLNKLQEKN